MKKILLFRTTARLSLSIATALCIVSALTIVSWVLNHDEWLTQWQEKAAAYRADREWWSGDRPQLCAQIRGDTLSPREALAKIGKNPPREALPEFCDPTSVLHQSLKGGCDELARKIEEREKLLTLELVGCVEPRVLSFQGQKDRAPLADPGSFRQYVWEERKRTIQYTPLGLLIFAVVTFLSLSGGRLFLTESHLGWKRLSLLLGAVAALVVPVGYVLAEGSSISWDAASILIMAFFGLATFPLAILLVLGGKRLTSWVTAGFRHDAVSGSRPDRARDHVKERAQMVEAEKSGTPTEPAPEVKASRWRGSYLWWVVAIVFLGVGSLVNPEKTADAMGKTLATTLFVALLAGLVWVFRKRK